MSVNTVAYLDVTRTQLVEIPLGKSRNAADIQTTSAGKQLVFQWPGTRSWTLQPIQLTSDFSETANWEAVKLRLSDFACDPNYWREVPEGTRGDQNGGQPFDYFYHGVVSRQNLPAGTPYSATGSGALLMAGLSNVAPDLTLIAPNPALQQDNGVYALQSLQSYPMNQGWCVRFWVDGRTSYKRTGILDIAFGEYCLRVNTNGGADLYQSVDGSSYAPVYTFQWSDAEQVHERWHGLTLFPHGRNKIEFLSKTLEQPTGLTPLGFLTAPHIKEFHGLYEVPGELVVDPQSGRYRITQPGPVGVRIHREFRPWLQVSRLAFYNGAPGSSVGQAYLYDSPLNLPLAPSMQAYVAIDGDANGGEMTFGLADPATGAIWQPGIGASPQWQFFCTFQGVGDIAGPGLASSVSPELYRYAWEKGALFQTVARNTVTTPVMSIQIDTGEAPEAERLTQILANDANAFRTDIGRLGQLERFARRPHVPVQLVNTGQRDPRGNPVVWFEGTVFRTESNEAPSKGARTIVQEARGMAWSLLHRRWYGAVPDFGANPEDGMQPWYWDAALVRCFQACGFDVSQVVIEEAAHYRFRLWVESGAGGSRGGNGSTTGHVAQAGTRWLPGLGQPCYEFIAHLIEDVLGWAFTWDKRDHSWHIYKRPNPALSVDQYKLAPKAAFYNSTARARQAPDNVAPAYQHTELRFESHPPTYTTLVCSAPCLEAGVLTRQGVQDQIAAQTGGGALPTDPSLAVTDRQISCTFDNFNGYASPRHPSPDTTSPDYVGEQLLAHLQLSVPNRECLEFIGRNVYYEQCFGHTAATFRSWWGDYVTANLRKWDVILIDSGPQYQSEPWFIDRIEPEFVKDTLVRARYRCYKLRPDAPPPR